MNIKFLNISQSNNGLIWPVLLFYIPLLISVVFIISVPVYPSLDGAAHLYNSGIIKELLFNSSNPYLDDYEFNKVLVPNWLDHVLLVILLLVLSPVWAQKVVLIILVISQAILFRKIIIALKPGNQLLSCLVLPFIFGSFFHVGLYNQQLSFVILYAFIYWLIKTDGFSKLGVSFYAGIFFFSLLFWFSSIVTYAVVLIIIGIMFLIKAFYEKLNFIEFAKKSAYLALVFLPGLLLSLNFVNATKMVTDEKQIALLDKLILFLRLEPLIVFDTPGESMLTIPLGIIILILAVLGFRRGSSSHLVVSALKIVSGFLLVALFLIPNQAGAGMLSFRFAMLFYLVAIVVILTCDFNFKYLLGAAIVVTGIHIGLTFKRHNGRIRNYSTLSHNFLEVGKHLPKGASIWPVSFSDDWFVGHSNNLAGIHQSVINYENYETYYPWFPLRFKEDKQAMNDLYNQLRIKNELTAYYDIPAEYVILSGLNESNLAVHKRFISMLSSPEMVYQLPDSSMKLYKLR